MEANDFDGQALNVYGTCKTVSNEKKIAKTFGSSISDFSYFAAVFTWKPSRKYVLQSLVAHHI